MMIPGSASHSPALEQGQKGGPDTQPAQGTSIPPVMVSKVAQVRGKTREEEGTQVKPRQVGSSSQSRWQNSGLWTSEKVPETREESQVVSPTMHEG